MYMLGRNWDIGIGRGAGGEVLTDGKMGIVESKAAEPSAYLYCVLNSLSGLSLSIMMATFGISEA